MERENKLGNSKQKHVYEAWGRAWRKLEPRTCRPCDTGTHVPIDCAVREAIIQSSGPSMQISRVHSANHSQAPQGFSRLAVSQVGSLRIDSFHESSLEILFNHSCTWDSSSEV